MLENLILLRFFGVLIKCENARVDENSQWDDDLAIYAALGDLEAQVVESVGLGPLGDRLEHLQTFLEMDLLLHNAWVHHRDCPTQSLQPRDRPVDVVRNQHVLQVVNIVFHLIADVLLELLELLKFESFLLLQHLF